MTIGFVLWASVTTFFLWWFVGRTTDHYAAVYFWSDFWRYTLPWFWLEGHAAVLFIWFVNRWRNRST